MLTTGLLITLVDIRTVPSMAASSRRTSPSMPALQGSAVGPASYVVTASDLKPVCEQNKLVKYADDMYIVIPACCSDSRSIEINGVIRWARVNNLQLNRGKTKEIIFVDKRRKRSVSEPPVLPVITRVTSLIVLGVTLTTGLSASDHVRHIISKTYIHIYSFITQNDRTHLHKIKIQVKNTNKSSQVKTVIKQLIRVFEQHAVNKIPFAQLTGDNT